MPDAERIATLKQVLEANPDDAFARYALALEYSNSGDAVTAVEEFQRLLATHPDYTNGYFMAAQTLMKVDSVQEARRMLEAGIESARRTHNRHAQAEMEGMLDEIGR
jgi:predicted Zn-dependent protease